MSNPTPSHLKTPKMWLPIPNGTRVKLRTETLEGVIDGLTELVTGPDRNPDGRTQYRINVGVPTRHLVAEDNLTILLGGDDLVVMLRQNEPYRRCVTEQLRDKFSADRFTKSAKSQKAHKRLQAT